LQAAFHGEPRSPVVSQLVGIRVITISAPGVLLEERTPMQLQVGFGPLLAHSQCHPSWVTEDAERVLSV
jgi:hypothetical protein